MARAIMSDSWKFWQPIEMFSGLHEDQGVSVGLLIPSPLRPPKKISWFSSPPDPAEWCQPNFFYLFFYFSLFSKKDSKVSTIYWFDKVEWPTKHQITRFSLDMYPYTQNKKDFLFPPTGFLLQIVVKVRTWLSFIALSLNMDVMSSNTLPNQFQWQDGRGIDTPQHTIFKSTCPNFQPTCS